MIKLNSNQHSLLKNEQFVIFMMEKIRIIKRIINNLVLSLQKHKKIDIFSNSDLNVCTSNLRDLLKKTEELDNFNEESKDEQLSEIQKLFDKLYGILSGFGTDSFDDIFYVVFGKDFELKSDYSIEDKNVFLSKLYLIKKYSSIIQFKVITYNKKSVFNKDVFCCDKLTERLTDVECCDQLECFEPNILLRSFDYTVNGLRICVHDGKNKRLILSSMLNDIDWEWIKTEPYIIEQNKNFIQKIESLSGEINKSLALRLLTTFTLKDYLIFGEGDFQKKYHTFMKDVDYVKTNPLTKISKTFLEMDLFNQRKFLIHLLTYNKDSEIQYAAYILYDLLTPLKNSTDNIDSDRQNLIYSSLPWNVKMYFKDSMKCSMNYSNDIEKGDLSRITLEQQVILMKASDIVKEKAFLKLKEIKGKPEDQGSKSKQYLEGLLRIPFGIYKKEPVLMKIDKLNCYFKILETNILFMPFSLKKEKYTVFEIVKQIKEFKTNQGTKLVDFLKQQLKEMNKHTLINLLTELDSAIETKSMNKAKILDRINSYFTVSTKNVHVILNRLPIENDIKTCFMLTFEIEEEISNLHDQIACVKNTIETSIFAHKSAKNQILKIISQWINGEQTGYCFGFEGFPGVGKTSLAKKGLANCLKDENGNPRPFIFIALGGSTNGSTLEGHSYTYVNSTWGKIVDALMDSKCMNPIIYIDELDKISKTEQGKELFGILTHLIDSTQNDEFNDKYFNGIPIDLSKVLFVFSYNDPDQIDSILLDRIHRIKFDNLSSKDKHEIVRRFVIPEINKKMGFENTVNFEDSAIEHIINSYTLEPGIRKLKEIIFDIFGEINMELLSKFSEQESIQLPIQINKENLEDTYLKEYKKIEEKEIGTSDKIGIINGLWANSRGKGGITTIESSFFPTSTFLELSLTGMQGDVMKESMNVAKTLAWNLTNKDIQKKLSKTFDETKNQGIHVHCPEGSVSKDGPSAGAAITIAIYSLLNNKKIKRTIAITGEITLNGDITKIGGIELKITGGIRAGIKTFLYPTSNQKEVDECIEKYESLIKEKTIEFIAVNRIEDAIKFVYQD